MGKPTYERTVLQHEDGSFWMYVTIYHLGDQWVSPDVKLQASDWATAKTLADLRTRQLAEALRSADE